jgi:hypothetical protein
MKKLAILSMTFLLTVAVTQGQTQKADKEKVKETKKELKTERVALKKLEGTNVSTISRQNFIADFKDAKNVVWKRIDTYDKATFDNKEGQSISAYYDIDGKLVGTTQYKTFADVPVSGQKEIRKMYKDYTIGPVIFFDDNELNSTDMIMYDVQFDDADNYFVELSKGTKKIVVQVNTEGVVFFFKELK